MTSASERLRELMDAPYPYRVPSVMRALPLIADVVEAAEKIVWLADNAMEHYNDLGMADTARAPLTALRNALEEK